MGEEKIEEKSGRKVVGRGVAVALGVVCLFLATGLVWAIVNYTSIINDLNANLASKNEQIDQLQTWLQGNITYYESQITGLETQIETLEDQIQILENEKLSLQSQLHNLKDRYNQLQSAYRTLEADYTDLSASYNDLVENYEKWRAYLETYIYLIDSFKRTLNDDEILSLTSLVESLVSDPDDWWRSVKQLYDYVAYNIQYVSDEPFPVPPTASELESGGYTNATVEELFMSPTETLELGQGDCDDQAVLLYALIKSYNKYVYGTDYELWIMDVWFKEAAHLAVAFPVSGGELTIIDPAGHYYTRWLLSLSSNDPYEELEKYSNYWSEYGGITYITLYSIYEGEAYEVISGSIQEVADFIEENY